MSSSFTRPLTVTKLRNGKWRVENSFDYHVGKVDSREVITVPKGFTTDFASVPRIFWTLIPPDGKYSQAAVLHDYLYVQKITTRKKADKIFLEAMKVLKVPFWKRRVMYYAVRLGGGFCW